MYPRLRILPCLILAVFLFGVSVVLGSSTASAEFGVKRSAGTRKSNGGHRKGNDLSSKTRGRSSMSSRSSSTRSGPSLPSDDDEDDDERERSRDQSSRHSGSHSSDRDDEDDEFERDSAPTLGRACIYGTEGEVVYRPKDSWCRGDAPAQSERARKSAEASSSGSSGSPNSARRAPPAASSAYRAPDRRREKKVKRKTSAGCLYGKSGEVLYAPATSDCVNGIGAPSRD